LSGSCAALSKDLLEKALDDAVVEIFEPDGKYARADSGPPTAGTELGSVQRQRCQPGRVALIEPGLQVKRVESRDQHVEDIIAEPKVTHASGVVLDGPKQRVLFTEGAAVDGSPKCQSPPVERAIVVQAILDIAHRGAPERPGGFGDCRIGLTGVSEARELTLELLGEIQVPVGNAWERGNRPGQTSSFGVWSRRALATNDESGRREIRHPLRGGGKGSIHVRMRGIGSRGRL
jgi:hypothetical protein